MDTHKINSLFDYLRKIRFSSSEILTVKLSYVFCSLKLFKFKIWILMPSPLKRLSASTACLSWQSVHKTAPSINQLSGIVCLLTISLKCWLGQMAYSSEWDTCLTWIQGALSNCHLCSNTVLLSKIYWNTSDSKIFLFIVTIIASASLNLSQNYYVITM